jgi:hypothetical protein
MRLVAGRRLSMSTVNLPMIGHASIHQTQRYLNVTDEELRTDRIGGELEEPRPTASNGIRKLIGLDRSPNCPRDLQTLVAGARNQHYLQLWRPAA